MSFLGGRKDDESPSQAQASAVRRTGRSGLFKVASTVAETTETIEIIREQSKFPGWVSVISGPVATGGLMVPVTMQNDLLAVKLTSGRVAIAYNPADAAVKKPMRLMRAYLDELGVPMESYTLAVVPEVLERIRLAAEGKAGLNAGQIRSAAVEQFKNWIRAAKDLEATDLHLNVLGGGRGQVMVRVDGELESLPDSDLGLTDNQVLTAMKSAFESLADRHSNSDGNFSEHETRSCIIDSGLGIPNLRLRYASQRGFFGPKAVIRLLTTEIDNEPRTLESMGFAPSQMAQYEKAQRLESGIILNCGVTGSGKTTVAKTFLETHPRNGTASIYQVADPVEYILRGVHQINVQRSLITLAESGKKDPYTEVIESLMRMDPDMVDVGEIRDSISARAAANVAKTGHLALATLHTDGIMGILNRLVDPAIGLSRSELTSGKVLGLMTYQALMPKLCPRCAMNRGDAIVAARMDGDDIKARHIEHVILMLSKRFKIDCSNMRFKNPEGCTQCRGRGTKGLTIVAEMMDPDDKWLDLAGQGKDRAAWKHYRETYSDRDLTSGDMTGKTVLEHAIFKSFSGMIDPCGLERFGDLEKYEVMI